MKLEDILQFLYIEKQCGSRFPVRIIFIEQLKQYKETIHSLKQVCDEVLLLSSYCKANDIFPNFRILHKSIDALEGKQILLLSMGEYLRLGLKRELQTDRAQFPPLWEKQQNAMSKTRVIVPLFACKELFERIVPFVNERQEDHLWSLEPVIDDSETFHLKMFSSQFTDFIQGDNIIYGFKKWLQEWDSHIVNKNCAIITSLFNNAENTSGTYSVKVIGNPFSYVAESVNDGNKLKKNWGTEKQWVSIIPYIINEDKICKAILKSLNIQIFEPVNILAQWRIMDNEQKWLVWIWYRLNESDDYYGYAIRNAESYEDIEYQICNSILDVVNKKSEWIEQRKQAMAALKIEKVNDDFWDKLDDLALPETKLRLLTCQTHEERTFAIRTVSRWLRDGATIDTVIEHVADKFDLLKAYFTPTCSDLPMELNDYFNWYKKQKIINRYPSTAENEVNKVNLDAYNSRFSILNQYKDKDAFFLWVDGMGIEWLPLLLTCLETYQPNMQITTNIASAILPTETCFNDQWKDYDLPYEKINKLDLLAHKGMLDDKDYYSCIDYQISTIDEIAMKAINILDGHDYIIITADHGSSRMAALSFHATPGIVAPTGSIVRNHGRYCELHGTPAPTDMLPCMRNIKNGDRGYLVMTTHEHYMQSGNAAGGNNDENAVAGEIHGGKTPEEFLVPVIVIERDMPLKPLDYIIDSTTVYRKKSNVRIALEFNRSITSLNVMAGLIKSKCTYEDGSRWIVTFENMELKSYYIDVYADGKLLEKHERFTVKAKGITENIDPFGDF